MFDPRPLCCSSLTTAVGGTKDTNFVDSKSPYRGTNHHHKWNNNELRQENGESAKKKSKAPQDTCYRCGMEEHWSRTCRTGKHLVDLYQASLKENGKKIKMNFTDSN